MAQKRYINYEQPLTSLEENYRILGLATPGILCGWDAFTHSGTQVTFNHAVTGMLKTDLVPTTQNGPHGIVVSNQGVVVLEDVGVTIEVPQNGAGNPRIDVIYMDHQHIEATGGGAATYSINQGAAAVNPVPPSPEVPDDKKQVVIGYLYVPAASGTHANTKWSRKQPAIGNKVLYGHNMDGSTWAANEFETVDFDRCVTPGLKIINTNTNAPNIGNSEWGLLIFSNGTKISQVATNLNNGKAYTRCNNGSWQSWINMNNADINDFSPQYLEDMVGAASLATINYSSNIYVTDGQALETAIGDLDAALNTVQGNLTSAETDINNNAIDIGGLSYANENVVTNGESLSSSVDALDLAIGERSYDENVVLDGEPLANSIEKLDIAIKPTPINISTFTANWVLIGSGYFRLIKDENGIVTFMVQGLKSNGSNASSPILDDSGIELPLGYRPASLHQFMGSYYETNTRVLQPLTIELESDGQVSVINENGNQITNLTDQDYHLNWSFKYQAD